MKIPLLFFSYFFIYLLRGILAIEQNVIQEFTANSFTTSDAPNWSKALVSTCLTTSYVDFSVLSVFGIFGKTNSLTKKTVSSLPPHWSASVRFDMLLYQALDAGVDYVNIQVDTQTAEKFQKNANSDGVKICGIVSNDILVLYNKNITHSATTLTLTITAQMNKIESLQGFVMKNLFIFVDTCHFSCATCSGPSSDQCLTCPTNATKTANSCSCNTGYFAYQYQCVSACPVGQVADSTNKLCVVDFCAASDCTTCTNKVCTVCAGSKKLLNGQCVASCPSYAPLTSGVCKDYSSTLTNGKYLIKGGLSADTFGESEVSGLGFVPNGFKGSGYDLQSGASVTRCGGKSLLGGAFLSGTGSYIQRTFAQMNPHWSVLIGYTLYKIDSWENERVEMNIDGSVKQSTIRTSTDGSSNLCGNSYKEDIIQVSQNFTHVLPTMTLKVTTSLDQDPFDESYGIRDIYVLVDYCVTNCSNCDASGCLACANGYFLYKKSCYTACPSGTYQLSSTECADCHASCVTCSAGTNKSCLICKASTYLNPDNSCQSTCVSGYWPRNIDLTCQKCDTSCYNCISPGDSGSCTACSGNLYLINSQCQLNCPPNQTKVTSPNNNTCQACHSTCLTCSGTTANTCLSCLAPNLFLSTVSTCVTTCNSNQYKNTSNQTCSQCDISCATCSGATNSDCLTCSGSLYLNTATKQCVNICPDKYYKNVVNNQCTPCDSTCSSCTGSTKSDCSSCDLPRYFQAGSKQCVTSCNSSQYPDDSLKACKPCEPSCNTCSGSFSNNCKSCTGQLYLDLTQNKCVQTCPFRYYQDKINNICQKCDGSCFTCDNSTISSCLSCELPRYYQTSQKKCVMDCDQNQYKNNSTYQCLNCDSTCATCSGGAITDCNSCQGNLFLDKISRKCVTNCPSGYFKNTSNNECNLCNTECDSCFGGSSDNCLTCSTPKYFQPSTNKCVMDCALNEYKNKPTKSCAFCHSTCASCLLGTSTDCLSCSGNLYLDQNGNRCVTICPVGSFANPVNNLCESCDPSCLTCDKATEMGCTSCSSSLFFYKNTKQCLQECPYGSFVDKVNKSCFSCKESCKSCVDEKTCVNCKEGYFFENQQCLLICSNGNYANKNTFTCDPCNPECKTCYGPSNTECNECSDRNKASYKGQCVSSCPPLLYFELIPYPKCEACNYKCRDGCLGAGDEDCFSIKFQYQIIFYILLFKSAVWILSIFWGIRKDKYQRKIQITKVESYENEHKQIDQFTDSIKKNSRQASLVSEHLETLKDIEFDKDQNTMNLTTITQKIQRPVRRKRTTRLMSTVKPSIASFIETVEPPTITQSRKKNSIDALEISNQSISNNNNVQPRAPPKNLTYTMYSNQFRQRSNTRKQSAPPVVLHLKPLIQMNQIQKYTIVNLIFNLSFIFQTIFCVNYVSLKLNKKLCISRKLF